MREALGQQRIERSLGFFEGSSLLRGKIGERLALLLELLLQMLRRQRDAERLQLFAVYVGLPDRPARRREENPLHVHGVHERP